MPLKRFCRPCHSLRMSRVRRASFSACSAQAPRFFSARAARAAPSRGNGCSPSRMQLSRLASRMSSTSASTRPSSRCNRPSSVSPGSLPRRNLAGSASCCSNRRCNARRCWNSASAWVGKRPSLTTPPSSTSAGNTVMESPATFCWVFSATWAKPLASTGFCTLSACGMANAAWLASAKRAVSSARSRPSPSGLPWVSTTSMFIFRWVSSCRVASTHASLSIRAPVMRCSSRARLSGRLPWPKVSLLRAAPTKSGTGTKFLRTALGRPRTRSMALASISPGTSHSRRSAGNCGNSGAGTRRVTPSRG